jgi:hypothetical protein
VHGICISNTNITAKVIILLRNKQKIQVFLAKTEKNPENLISGFFCT